MNKSSLRTVALIWAAVMIAVVSSTVTLLASGRSAQPSNENSRFVSQEEYDTIRRYSRLEEVRKNLLTSYYKELDDDALMLGAIRGMTASVGDQYTFYYTPEEMKRANENNAGLYHGIGVLLQVKDGEIQVVRVYPGTPAESDGVRVGDVIMAVDGQRVSGADGRRYNEAVSLIRGAEDTRVTLTILRNGQQMDIDVRRGNVSVSYANSCVLEGDIGYIAISQFNGDASAKFHEAIASFREQNVKGLVIDLRNNPGGLLDQVVSVADAILPTGVIVYIRERDGNRQDFYSDEAMYDVPLAVLVNGMSASASEILASAVQAFGRGTIVGLNTYGKGIVQTLVPFQEDGAGLQLTTSSYYDALDRCPHEVGVKPDIEVALEGNNLSDTPDPASDNQLAAAIQDVRRQIGERGES